MLLYGWQDLKWITNGSDGAKKRTEWEAAVCLKRQREDKDRGEKRKEGLSEMQKERGRGEEITQKPHFGSLWRGSQVSAQFGDPCWEERRWGVAIPAMTHGGGSTWCTCSKDRFEKALLYISAGLQMRHFIGCREEKWMKVSTHVPYSVCCVQLCADTSQTASCHMGATATAAAV